MKFVDSLLYSDSAAKRVAMNMAVSSTSEVGTGMGTRFLGGVLTTGGNVKEAWAQASNPQSILFDATLGASMGGVKGLQKPQQNSAVINSDGTISGVQEIKKPQQAHSKLNPINQVEGLFDSDSASLGENAKTTQRPIEKNDDETMYNQWNDLKKQGLSAEEIYNLRKYGSIKTQLDYVPSNGIELKGVEGKTTTVLGSYKKDTKHIIKELKNIKSFDFDAKDGGFNLLNTPDECFDSENPEQFWNEYNKPFLDKAIQRDDIFRFVTDPIDSFMYRPNWNTGSRELTGFGREINYLVENGYEYDWVLKEMKKVGE